jgi:hypothetical protein
MERYGLQKRDVLPVSEAGQRMDVALEKLREAGTMKPIRRAGRLIFGLDLTGSREPSLHQARIATAAMFDTIKAFGVLAVKLIYYRGDSECKAGDWQADPGTVSRAMLALSCKTGETQIARMLRCALTEKKLLTMTGEAGPAGISGVVFIGDHSEDKPETLLELAAELGKQHMPLFLFHEIADHDERSLQAKPVFKRMAELSGGVYVEFRPDSGAVLMELLSSVAAFSAAGTEGVERMALPATSEARQLRGRLLLGSGDRKH